MLNFEEYFGEWGKMMKNIFMSVNERKSEELRKKAEEMMELKDQMTEILDKQKVMRDRLLRQPACANPSLVTC